jgi:hypothetical protein
MGIVEVLAGGDGNKPAAVEKDAEPQRTRADGNRSNEGELFTRSMPLYDCCNTPFGGRRHAQPSLAEICSPIVQVDKNGTGKSYRCDLDPSPQIIWRWDHCYVVPVVKLGNH